MYETSSFGPILSKDVECSSFEPVHSVIIREPPMELYFYNLKILQY